MAKLQCRSGALPTKSEGLVAFSPNFVLGDIPYCPHWDLISTLKGHGDWGHRIKRCTQLCLLRTRIEHWRGPELLCWVMFCFARCLIDFLKAIDIKNHANVRRTTQESYRPRYVHSILSLVASFRVACFKDEDCQKSMSNTSVWI